MPDRTWGARRAQADSTAMKRICSWCRAGMGGETGDGSASYGICRRCLSHQLRRLDVLDARAARPTPLG